MNETYLKPTTGVSELFIPIKITTITVIMVKGRTEKTSKISISDLVNANNTEREGKKNSRKLGGPIVRKY